MTTPEVSPKAASCQAASGGRQSLEAQAMRARPPARVSGRSRVSAAAPVGMHDAVVDRRYRAAAATARRTAAECVIGFHKRLGHGVHLAQAGGAREGETRIAQRLIRCAGQQMAYDAGRGRRDRRRYSDRAASGWSAPSNFRRVSRGLGPDRPDQRSDFAEPAEVIAVGTNNLAYRTARASATVAALEGRQAWRSTHRGTCGVRARHQHEHRESARPHRRFCCGQIR